MSRRDIKAEHRELRSSLERLESAAHSIVLDQGDELLRARTRAARTLNKVAPIQKAPRRQPAPEPGERFGERTVVAVHTASKGKRADRRVEWRCSCGETGTAYLFNFRRMTPECLHGDVREARSA